MESACTLCVNLVIHDKAHPSLKKISAIKDSELYKCSCCYAYLHKHHDAWEVISGGSRVQESDSVTGKRERSDSRFSDLAQRMLAARTG